MDKIFSNSSWKILESESSDVDIQKNIIDNKMSKTIKLKYLKPIYYDTLIKVNVEYCGEIIFQFNNLEYKLNCTETTDKILEIKNFNLKDADLNKEIKSQNTDTLILTVTTDTVINKLKFIQNIDFDNCNPCC